MTSLSGLKGLPGQTNYSAAKGGLIAATKALAQEVAKEGYRQCCCTWIHTDRHDQGFGRDRTEKEIPANRFGTPEEVAAVVGFLASEEASYVTGQVISVNGGLYSLIYFFTKVFRWTNS